MAPMFKFSYNFKKEEVCFPDVWESFVKLYKKKKLNKVEYEYFISLGMENIKLKVYIPFILDILAIIENTAYLHGIRFSWEWFTKDVPILIFMK